MNLLFAARGSGLLVRQDANRPLPLVIILPLL